MGTRPPSDVVRLDCLRWALIDSSAGKDDWEVFDAYMLETTSDDWRLCHMYEFDRRDEWASMTFLRDDIPGLIDLLTAAHKTWCEEVEKK